MEWWRWAAAGLQALLVVLLLALRLDTLRDRVGSNAQLALRAIAPWSLLVPAGFLAVLLVPWWVGLILIAIPALAIAAMEMAS